MEEMRKQMVDRVQAEIALSRRADGPVEENKKPPSEKKRKLSHPSGRED
jgi:hypothetical protein